ncbi:unnamed protein product [Spirodela intermedia]|uniref:Uncharacterized protein n=2 Tax=Spirodela intermedia TaxID=51605 RepID=A0A7I8LFG4_SPIIN|nr:unnamed protein product [Spirodela intermedia]CAA6670949.1 unnamed protein product [Spirodela intermedia]CAA7408048.1 unnamed protein product [Spirodela intermedia]
MAARAGGRRLSLDLLQRATVSEVSLASEVKRVECECCGLAEDCTGGYVRRVKERFCGRWVCGLCAEAVKEELERRVPREEALRAHMEVCRSFNRTVRPNPAMSLAAGMTEILKKGSRRAGRGGSKKKSCTFKGCTAG